MQRCVQSVSLRKKWENPDVFWKKHKFCTCVCYDKGVWQRCVTKVCDKGVWDVICKYCKGVLIAKCKGVCKVCHCEKNERTPMCFEKNTNFAHVCVMTKVCDKGVWQRCVTKVCDKSVWQICKCDCKGNCKCVLWQRCVTNLQMCFENPRVFLRTHLCLADHLCVKHIHVWLIIWLC